MATGRTCGAFNALNSGAFSPSYATLAGTRCSGVAAAILVTGDLRLNPTPLAHLNAELPAVGVWSRVISTMSAVIRTGNNAS